MIQRFHAKLCLCLSFFVVFFSASVVDASCGSASCPIDTRSWKEDPRRSIRIGYEFEYVDQDQPRIGGRDASVGEIHGHHDEARTINRIHRLRLGAGITDRFSIDLALPFVSRTHEHIHTHMGTPFVEAWGFTGVGDLSVQGRYALIKPTDASRPTVFGTLGMEFPTGRTTFLNEDGDEAEIGVTPGSGSYDGLAGLSTLQHVSVPTIGKDFALMPIFTSVNLKVNGKGREDYQIGNSLSVGAGVVYPITAKLGWMTQLNYVHQASDDAGETGEEVEKTGGDYIYVSPGLQLRLTDQWEITALVQLPLLQRVNVIQLTAPYNLLVSVGYRFFW